MGLANKDASDSHVVEDALLAMWGARCVAALALHRNLWPTGGTHVIARKVGVQYMYLQVPYGSPPMYLLPHVMTRMQSSQHAYLWVPTEHRGPVSLVFALFIVGIKLT